MISVHDVSMRFGSKLLFEDVTTTFSKGRRYGLTGPNGSGKSTFMKLLTGESLPQKGTVVAARQARRAPPGSVRLRRRSASSTPSSWATRGCGRRSQAREALYAKAVAHRRRRHAPRRARGHRRRRRRLLGGERRGGAAPGPRHPDDVHERTMSRAAERAEGARAARAGALRPSRGAAARRADEPPRPRLDPLAARVPHPLRRHAHRHLARSPFPERRLHAHRRHRLRRRSSPTPAATTTWCWPRCRSARASRPTTRSARRRSRS